ncbi:hypothetical protein HPB49_022122 [Dermacentor silvarum]|uniref:Uncharacterized protein n=1 Tax=Dermacentor silvarum TaxID=543639 RepID=A0ACB8CT22_DERSI|nr:hypothetical protein HPB49_022122 [Dermacentor silvarum]
MLNEVKPRLAAQVEIVQEMAPPLLFYFILRIQSVWNKMNARKKWRINCASQLASLKIWKNVSYAQPIGVFAAKSATKGTVLAQLLLQALVLMEEAGAKIHGFVCDGASKNRSMWSTLGISGNLENCCNAITHPSDPTRKVFAFSDVPHLFKCIRNRLLQQKYLKKEGKWIRWEDYSAVYNEDKDKAGGLRVCPKITHSHIYPSTGEKMRVKLATQVFSRSMASGIKFYRDQGVRKLGNSETTEEFTLFLNDLFDALNRRFPAEGITTQSSDLGVVSRGIQWLDSWEKELQCGLITKDMFLTESTSEGLRVTLKSTRELCNALLQDHNFKYVLTSKMNQDPIERFFGKIRLAGSQNDHPSMPTFLQLYQTLSIYTLLKPPKFGNCRVVEGEKPLLDISDFRALINQTTVKASSVDFVEEVKLKLDSLICVEDWECDDVIGQTKGRAGTEVEDCIVYYLAGFMTRKMNNSTRCLTSYADAQTVYWDTIVGVLDTYTITFPCDEHKEEIVAQLLHCYVSMRMRQHCKHVNMSMKKEAQERKKMAKLCSS